MEMLLISVAARVTLLWVIRSRRLWAKQSDAALFLDSTQLPFLSQGKKRDWELIHLKDSRILTIDGIFCVYPRRGKANYMSRHLSGSFFSSVTRKGWHLSANQSTQIFALSFSLRVQDKSVLFCACPSLAFFYLFISLIWISSLTYNYEITRYEQMSLAINTPLWLSIYDRAEVSHKRKHKCRRQNVRSDG